MKIIYLIFMLLSSSLIFAEMKVSELPCVKTLEMEMGTLCAIRPSLLNPKAKDSGDGGFFIKRLGFGYHVVGVPKVYKGKIHLHLGGTFGRPYNPLNDKFPSRTFLNEAMEKGFMAIQLAYDNQNMVNGNKLCGKRSSFNGVDNCSKITRLSKWKGGKGVGENFVTQDDSIEHRFKDISDFLIKRRFGEAVDYSWEKVSVSGHSQGAGMALFMSYQIKLNSVCLFAGGYDSPDRVNPKGDIADWILEGKPKVELSKIRGIIHKNDKHFEMLMKGYKNIGLIEKDLVLISSEEEMHDDEGREIHKGHAGVMKAVELGTLRKSACLEL